MIDSGYTSNLLKKLTFHSLILNIWPTSKDSIEARYLKYLKALDF